MKMNGTAWVLLCAVSLLVGFMSGMMMQQMGTRATIESFADNLDGVQIDIDLNETKIIDGITDFYKPYFDEMINESGEQDG